MTVRILLALLALCAVGITGASAQELLSGQYQRIRNCKGQQLVHITQNGWDLNLVNEAVSYRAPGSIIPVTSRRSAGTKVR